VRRTLRQSFAQILRSERSPYLRGNLCCFRPRTLGQASGFGDPPSRFRIFSQSNESCCPTNMWDTDECSTLVCGS
jgi:hypothetical protein